MSEFKSTHPQNIIYKQANKKLGFDLTYLGRHTVELDPATLVGLILLRLGTVGSGIGEQTGDAFQERGLSASGRAQDEVTFPGLRTRSMLCRMAFWP